MHRIFQTFIDRLAESTDAVTLRTAMKDAAAALDLHCFAYLSVPRRLGAEPQLVSTYPSGWTTYYLQQRYERVDPVLIQARGCLEPFEWGPDVGPLSLSRPQRQKI